MDMAAVYPLFLALVMAWATTSGVLGEPIEGRKPYYIVEELPADTLMGNVAMDVGLTEKYDDTILRKLYYNFVQPAETPDEMFELFAIDPSSSIIKTAKKIDRDEICARQVTCYVRFDVTVGPPEYFEIIKIIIDILDVNDHSPEFVEKDVFLKFPESTIPGSSYSLPTAVDPDSSTYSIQQYALIAHTSKFELITKDGPDGVAELHLVIREKLDREEADFYQFQVMAYDGGNPPLSGSMLINIEVEDSNDNDPKFENATYEVFVLENIDPGTIIARVQAHDLDTGSNGKVTYSFSQRTKNDFGHLFGISNTTGTIHLKEALDFEHGSTYLLVVLASDLGLDSQPAHASVVVRVEDSNDNPPEINVNSLTANGIAQVAESAGIGTFVAHISVMDQDGGDNGRVDCKMSHPKFELKSMSDNQFKLVTSSMLDKENEPQYQISVACHDLGFRPKTSTVDIMVRVLDDNDHSPRFQKQIFLGLIQENNFIEEEILVVNATDRDHGVNGDIRYRIEASDKIVTINQVTGSIRAAAVFDREQMEEYTFKVVAYDQGAPSLSSTATVVISITDENDEPPQFSQNNFAFGTFENQPINTEVGAVEAVDKDTPQFAKIKFKFGFPSSNASKTFSIDPVTGKIYTRQVLDREVQPVYYLKVIASSDLFPPMSSSASVTIYVADKNDNAPVIQWPTVYNNTVYVSSLVPKAYEIAQIQAADKDIGSNGKLLYHITGGNQQSLFDVNPVIGKIVTNKDISNIIYEVFILTLTVEDDGYPKLSTSSVINIVVNQSISYNPTQRIMYTNNNTTIIISLTSASLILIFLLVIAILLVRRQTSDRKSSATEAQKMLHRDSSPPEWAAAQKDTNCVQVNIPSEPSSSSNMQAKHSVQTHDNKLVNEGPTKQDSSSWQTSHATNTQV